MQLLLDFCVSQEAQVYYLIVFYCCCRSDYKTLIATVSATERSVNMGESVPDFIAGWFAGCAGVIAGQPADTVKARLQTQGTGVVGMRYKSMTHCFADITKTEGIRGLYKGMAYPLIGQGAINATVFGVHRMGLKILQPEGGQPKIHHNILAGGIAGAVQCVICCPMELIKLRMQVQGIAQARQSMAVYHGPWKTAVKIYRQGGVIALNKGMVPTLYRETMSFATYFTTYDYLCQTMAGKGSVDDLGLLKLMFAGAVTGIPTWLVSYPFDVVKSRIQVDGVHAPRQYHGLVDCFRKSYAEGGLRVFGRGLQSTILRAVIINAATLPTYTLLMRSWEYYKS